MYDVFLVVMLLTSTSSSFFTLIAFMQSLLKYGVYNIGLLYLDLLAVRIKAVALLLVQVAWVCKSKYGCSVHLSWPKVNIIFWRADSVWTRKGNLRSPFGVHALWCEVVFGQYCTFMALKAFYCLYLHLYLNLYN